MDFLYQPNHGTMNNEEQLLYLALQQTKQGMNLLTEARSKPRENSFRKNSLEYSLDLHEKIMVIVDGK